MYKNFQSGLILVFLILWSGCLYAYPSFISYGYKSCLTCHFNGQGNGGLNDYGRALFSTEIASRAFYDPKTSLDELGESSGFLGKKPLPWWFRPGVKFRGLWFQNDPGSQVQKNRFIPMQADVNMAFLFDQEQKWILVTSTGYMPTPYALQSSSGEIDKPSNWVSREHYVRWQVSRELFAYLGLMDKVYGIRTIDHTAFSRIKTGLAQNDQTHGLMLQYYMGTWEYTVHTFAGNMAQKAPLRQKGGSVMIEKDIEEKHRVGGAVMYSQNEYMNWTRIEAHSKLGFGQGHSFLSEIGYIDDKPKYGDWKKGGYVFVEGLALLAQGYNFLSQVEFYNQTLSTKSPDQFKWTFGFLMFPAPRFELRTTLVNQRIQSDTGISNDLWQLQLQTHMSL